jgi:hypothetical protein
MNEDFKRLEEKLDKLMDYSHNLGVDVELESKPTWAA